VLISGLPGSGKTRLAHRLAPLLGLPVIDKDDILEGLFESKGVGDAAWRRALSRESDAIFQSRALASNGAILVSFWHSPGMPADSGTAVEWLHSLAGRIVQIHCRCDPEIAASRFGQRVRHPGHLDLGKSHAGVLTGLQKLSQLPVPVLGSRIDVDTTQDPDLSSLVHEVRSFLALVRITNMP